MTLSAALRPRFSISLWKFFVLFDGSAASTRPSDNGTPYLIFKLSPGKKSQTGVSRFTFEVVITPLLNRDVFLRLSFHSPFNRQTNTVLVSTAESVASQFFYHF